MADQSTHNSTLEELEKLCKDGEFWQLSGPHNETPCK